jgi:hypothetical protein
VGSLSLPDLIILGLDHPGKKLNVMLKPWIEELKEL